MRYVAAVVIAIAIFAVSVGWDGDWSDFSLVGLVVANTVLCVGCWLQLRKRGRL